MTKAIIHTNAAPAAVGPYSQAVVAPAGTTVYLSGQIGLVPATGEMISEQFEEQVKQSFENMRAVVEAAGGRLDLSQICNPRRLRGSPSPFFRPQCC